MASGFMASSYRQFHRGLTYVALGTVGMSSLFLSAFALETAQDLTVEITGLRNQKGSVCVALFDNGAGFPSDATKAIQTHCFKVVATTQKVSLGPLKSGRYAMSLLHDENEDQKLNTGFLGIPREGIGFSGNPRIHRQIKFDETSFDFQPNTALVQITVKYF